MADIVRFVFGGCIWRRYGVALDRRIDKLLVSFAKETYKKDNILQKRPIN